MTLHWMNFLWKSGSGILFYMVCHLLKQSDSDFRTNNDLSKPTFVWIRLMIKMMETKWSKARNFICHDAMFERTQPFHLWKFPYFILRALDFLVCLASAKCNKENSVKLWNSEYWNPCQKRNFCKLTWDTKIWIFEILGIENLEFFQRECRVIGDLGISSSKYILQNGAVHSHKITRLFWHFAISPP